MKVTVDKSAGFCWGVVRTIDMAEDLLKEKNGEDIYVLGQIIHNPREIERLEKKGLKTISHEDLSRLANTDAKVIIRAHGEPPSTYTNAEDMGVNIVDATCPLVTSLQKRVKKFHKEGYQIVVFGKKNHAEVIGLRGVVNDDCIVVTSVEEAKEKVNFEQKTVLLSQTTMDKRVFQKVKDTLEEKAKELIDAGELNEKFLSRDTVCRHVTDREEPLVEFVNNNDVIVFVSGKKSSNGKSLYTFCKSMNERTYFVEDYSEIDYSWFDRAEKIGITGATSTPQWYMEKVKDKIDSHFELVEK